MNKQLSIWQFIHQNLQQNIAVILLYVLESKGSSPGRQGFFMAVNANGDMAGSIGGGVMEYKLVTKAKAQLRNTTINETLSLKKEIHDKAAGENQSGMICSGEQTILLYQIQQQDLYIIESIIFSLGNHQNGTLLLSPGGLAFSKALPNKDFEFVMKSDSDWTYNEKTGYKNQLFIVGGGHCALALSQLMSTLDFYIRLYDERSDLNTIQQNSFVHEQHIVKDYSELTLLIPSGNNHYVVIMTVGYRTDYTALKALLPKDFKYMGVLGSKKKMEKLFANFQLENENYQKLHHVNTPIGISINSHTPEEIAVSIAAEIITVKNAE